MEAARHWRTRRARYALEGTCCGRCGKVQFPPRQSCQACGSATTQHTLTGQGTVYSYSVVRQAPDGFADQVPYTVALVALDEGPLVAAQLTDVDPQQLRIGLPVEMVTRRVSQDGPRGVVVYGYKFRPKGVQASVTP